MNAPADTLEAPRRALSDAAVAHAAAPHDLAALELLCRKAVAYAEARGKLRPSSPASRPTAANPGNSPGRTLVPFGRRQGNYLDDCTPAELRWLREAVERSVDDPEKARFKAKNEALIADITAVLVRDGEE